MDIDQIKNTREEAKSFDWPHSGAWRSQAAQLTAALDSAVRLLSEVNEFAQLVEAAKKHAESTGYSLSTTMAARAIAYSCGADPARICPGLQTAMDNAVRDKDLELVNYQRLHADKVIDDAENLSRISELEEKLSKVTGALKTAKRLVVAHHNVKKMSELRNGAPCPVCCREDGSEPEMTAISEALFCVDRSAATLIEKSGSVNLIEGRAFSKDLSAVGEGLSHTCDEDAHGTGASDDKEV